MGVRVFMHTPLDQPGTQFWCPELEGSRFSTTRSFMRIRVNCDRKLPLEGTWTFTILLMR